MAEAGAAGTVRVRDSEDADVEAIAHVYGHWVQHGLASFELTPPDANEIRRRRAAILAGGYPHLVATGEDGRVLGYGYAGPYRTRPAYRFACEDSVYVTPGAGRKGIGRRLLETLITRCEAIGLRLMVAIIGDSGNESSIGLHRALGFTQAGVLPSIGWKHGRWVDTVLMVRALGAGASMPPVDRAAGGPS
jgi:L-amino acid N-acyltransferase YncA